MAKVPLNDIHRLQGKAAIVTGEARGIGRGIAERLAEAGANVIVSDIDEGAGAATAAAIGAEFIRADVTSEEDLRNLVSSTVAKHGTIDILVNNAGIYPFKTGPRIDR